MGTSVSDIFGHILYIPGAYSAAIVLESGVVYVTVTVDAFNITDVRLTNMGYVQLIRYPLFLPVMETLRHDILAAQSVDIEPPAMWPSTGQLLLDAINVALGQAYVHTIHPGI